VKSQKCYGISQYDRCSPNTACGCFHIAGASNTGICAYLEETCSKLVSCISPNNSCYEPDHICVHHPRCYLHPVCYPMPRINREFCPPVASKRINSDLLIPLHFKSFFQSVFFTVHTPLIYAISVGVKKVKKSSRSFGKLDKMRVTQKELYLLEKGLFWSHGWYPIVSNAESIAVLPRKVWERSDRSFQTLYLNF
jgi:hypothetical protein